MNILLEQGMGTDNDLHIAREDRRQLLLALPALILTGEQDTCLIIKPLAKIHIMLFGKDLRRRHDGDLPAGIDHRNGSRSGDHGLTGTHIPLQEAVQANLELVGGPEYTEKEQAFARQLQRNLEIEEKGGDPKSLSLVHNGLGRAYYLWKSVDRAIEHYRHPGDWWTKLALSGMRQDFSWDASADHYIDCYRQTMEF